MSEELPGGWALTTVGDASSAIQYGYTASAIQKKDGPRFLRITDIQDGAVDWAAVPSCEIDHDSIPRFGLAAGDIVFARTGATTGKSFLLRQCPPAVFASYLIRLRPRPEVEPGFLAAFFRTPEYWNLISENISGNAQPNCNASKLAKLPIPLPPLAEQQRIVAKVEELLSRVNAARRRLTKAPAILKRFRQSVLAAACSGRLTADWREENALDSAPSIPGKNAGRLPPIDDGEVFFEAPRSWQWIRLGDLATFINGDRGANYPNKSEYVPSGIPFINTGHIEPDGSLSSESMHFLTREKFESLRSGKIQVGDLVYCLRGATLGKTAFVRPYEEGAIASSLVIIRVNASLDPVFLYEMLTSPYGKELVDRFDNGSAQPNLSAESVKHYVVPLPSLPEQHEIVRRVEALFKLADAIEKRVAAATTRADKLTQAILAKAFCGELVPTEAELARKEGREYEPASVLLERIKASTDCADFTDLKKKTKRRKTNFGT